MNPGARSWPAIDVAPGESPDLLQATLTDFDVLAIDEAETDRWRVYFSSAAERDRAASAVSSVFPDLLMTAVDVPDEDWAALSQASLRAIHVGKIIVAPPWDAPLTIVIKPSMGFGTGHHATTRLCLDALQHVDVKDRTVLDIGTGSGVLAIAASLLGAAEVAAIDEDADAVQAAWDNLALNTGAVVSLLVGDVRSTALTAADIVVANVTGGMLSSTADRIRQLTTEHGQLILSGFLSHEEQEVLAAYPGWIVQRRSDEDGWVCVTLAGSR